MELISSSALNGFNMSYRNWNINVNLTINGIIYCTVDFAQQSLVKWCCPPELIGRFILLRRQINLKNTEDANSIICLNCARKLHLVNLFLANNSCRKQMYQHTELNHLTKVVGLVLFERWWNEGFGRCQ